MVINIENKSQFVNSFLRPISALTESVVIKNVNNQFICIANNEQGLILCATYNTGITDTIQLNIPNVKRLEKVISFIETDDLKLDYKANALSYKDKKIRFKYHFLDDNIIQSPKLSMNKINSLTSEIEFKIDYSKISELAKGAAFVSESDKLYFNLSSEGVHGEITDKSNSSVDSYSILLTEENVNVEKSFPVHFDIVRLLANTSGEEVTVKINTEMGFCLFEVDNGVSKLKYIVSGLQQ